jgi:hypothetical protein
MFSTIQGYFGGNTQNPSNTVYNGRVDLLSPMSSFQINPNTDVGANGGACGNQNLFTSEGARGQIAPNPISDLYFSSNNVNVLQDGIRYKVWKETQQRYTIGRQNDNELRIVMRSIYFQYAKHQPKDIVGQVRELNAKVLEWVVPEIVSNLRQHERYRVDASQLPMPLEHPTMMTQKGTKVLEIKRFI